MKVFKLLLLAQKFLNIGHHVKATIMTVSLSWQKKLIARSISFPNSILNLFLIIEFLLKVLSDSCNYEIPLFQHAVTIDDLSWFWIFGSQEIFHIENNDTKPVREGVDRNDYIVLFENILRFSPSFDFDIILFHFLDGS